MPPAVLTYSLESTIAEKFETMLRRDVLNSRMKDFYDIYDLENRFNFDGALLCAAIGKTFDKRGTSYSKDSLARFRSFAENTAMQKRWLSFLKTIDAEPFDFALVIDEIHTFIKPVFTALLNGEAYSAHWTPQARWLD